MEDVGFHGFSALVMDVLIAAVMLGFVGVVAAVSAGLLQPEGEVTNGTVAAGVIVGVLHGDGRIHLLLKIVCRQSFPQATPLVIRQTAQCILDGELVRSQTVLRSGIHLVHHSGLAIQILLDLFDIRPVEEVLQGAQRAGQVAVCAVDHVAEVDGDFRLHLVHVQQADIDGGRGKIDGVDEFINAIAVVFLRLNRSSLVGIDGIAADEVLLGLDVELCVGVVGLEAEVHIEIVIPFDVAAGFAFYELADNFVVHSSLDKGIRNFFCLRFCLLAITAGILAVGVNEVAVFQPEPVASNTTGFTVHQDIGLLHDDYSIIGNFYRIGHPDQFTVVEDLVIPGDGVVLLALVIGGFRYLSSTEFRRIAGIPVFADILAFAGDPVAVLQNDPGLAIGIRFLHGQLPIGRYCSALFDPCDGIEGIADLVGDIRHQVDLFTGLQGGVEKILQHFHQLFRIIDDSMIRVLFIFPCIWRVCGDPFQNLCTAFSCTHAQTDGHQDGFTAVITLGFDTNLIAPVLGSTINRCSFAFRIIWLTQRKLCLIRSNRCTIRDQDRVGVLGTLVIEVLVGQMIFIDILQCDIRSGTAAGVDIADLIDQHLHLVGRQGHRTNALVMIRRLVKPDQCHGTIVIGVGELVDGVGQGILEVVQTVQLTVGPVERVVFTDSITSINVILNCTLTDLIVQTTAITFDLLFTSRCNFLPIIVDVCQGIRCLGRLFTVSTYSRVHRKLTGLLIAGSVLVIRLGIIRGVLEHPVLTIIPDGVNRRGDTGFSNDVVELICKQDTILDQLIQLFLGLSITGIIHDIRIVYGLSITLFAVLCCTRIKTNCDLRISSIFARNRRQARREKHGVGLIDNKDNVHRVHLIQTKVGFRRQHDLVGAVVVVLHLGDLVRAQQIGIVVQVFADAVGAVENYSAILCFLNSEFSFGIHVTDVASCGGDLLNGIGGIVGIGVYRKIRQIDLRFRAALNGCNDLTCAVSDLKHAAGQWGDITILICCKIVESQGINGGNAGVDSLGIVFFHRRRFFGYFGKINRSSIILICMGHPSVSGIISEPIGRIPGCSHLTCRIIAINNIQIVMQHITQCDTICIHTKIFLCAVRGGHKTDRISIALFHQPGECIHVCTHSRFIQCPR